MKTKELIVTPICTTFPLSFEEVYDFFVKNLSSLGFRKGIEGELNELHVYTHINFKEDIILQLTLSVDKGKVDFLKIQSDEGDLTNILFDRVKEFFLNDCYYLRIK